MKFAEWAKAYVALAGLIGVAVVGVPDIPLAWRLPLQIVVAVSGAFAVWKVENRPAEPPADDFDPPAPNWKSAGPAWDEPLSPEEPKSLYLVPAPVGRQETNGAPAYRLVA